MNKLFIPEEFRSESDFPKRDVRLYSITGFFASEREKGCAAFGGYFRFDVLSEILFDGQLIDRWGASVIKGRMSEENLEFEKMYHRNKNLFNYTFRKENGIWIGEYNGENVNGISQCVTDDIADAWNINCGAPYKGTHLSSVEDLKELDLSHFLLP